MASVKTRHNAYLLPDLLFLENNEEQLTHYVWQPDKTYIVLGQSNKLSTSVRTDRAMRDGIPVMKRPSGGEAVLLTPRTLVIAFLGQTKHFKKPLSFFKDSNIRIIKALEKWPGIEAVHQRGISDLSVGIKKIAGSSIYRTRTQLFYHAVLNVSEPIENLDNYLLHPQREPDYRKGRSHKEFVTSLHELGYTVSIKELKTHLQHNL